MSFTWTSTINNDRLYPGGDSPVPLIPLYPIYFRIFRLHVPIKAPSLREEDYISRKSFHSINVQVGLICSLQYYN